MEKLTLRSCFKDRPEYMLLDEPPAGGNVWPHQGCPCFLARLHTLPPDPGQECWYCAYADFHLDRDRALDVGICQYPKKNHL